MDAEHELRVEGQAGENDVSDGPHDSRLGDLTTQNHWEETWSQPPRMRLPSRLAVSTRNIQRILQPEVRHGLRVIELGCAPGKILAWMASLGGEVAGLDFSDRGVAWTRRLLKALGIPGDIRCENALQTTFDVCSFDLVYSFGLIEHFDDPRPIVQAHVALAKPGGRIVIAVPHYGGIYGRLQRWFDPGNLSIHNLDIMSVDALRRLAPPAITTGIRAYKTGRLSPWLLGFEQRWPRGIARPIAYALNSVGLLQPLDIGPLCPLLVLEMTKSTERPC